VFGNRPRKALLRSRGWVAWTTQLWKAVLSGSGAVAAISPVILTGAQSDTMVASEANRPDDVRQEVKAMSYATMQDVLFDLDLDRFRVAEPAGATPRRARGRTRGAVQVALRSRAQSSGQAQGSHRRAAQANAISP
jgi:hypothetical protein